MPRAHGCAGAAQLKTPYRDDTTHVMFELLDFIAHLPAMVPKSRVNLTHNHDLYFRAVLLIRVAAD